MGERSEFTELLEGVIKLTVGNDCWITGAGLTVKDAGLLVTVPEAFVTTHSNSVPLWETDVAGMVYDAPVAPLTGVYAPPLTLCIH